MKAVRFNLINPMRNDIIGHWYLKDLGGPFRNFLDCDPEEREQIAGQLKERYGRSYFHEEYLTGRDEVEKKLYRRFVDQGGKPQITRPIYCFLGANPSELIYERRDHYSFKFFKIADIPSELISFTYPGSIASFQIAEKESASEFRSSYHGKVYRKDEINNVIAEFGMPGIDFIPTRSRQYDVLVEAQIWSADIFEDLDEVIDVEVSWLPWVTNPPPERAGLKKD